MSGLWEAFDAFWVNDPKLGDATAKKSFHLRAAAEAGLITPPTLITNDVDDARAFVGSMGPGRTIYKSFSATETHWRETRLLQPGEEDLLGHVRLAPVIFQQLVPADVDLRVTIVGDRQFPAAISTRDGGYAYDYRIDLATARVEATTLPPDVGAALARLMRRLGLVFGAVDMRRTPDGQYIFLEINPAGLWLFVEEQTGQPVTRALAELLVQHDTPANKVRQPVTAPPCQRSHTAAKALALTAETAKTSRAVTTVTVGAWRRRALRSAKDCFGLDQSQVRLSTPRSPATPCRYGRPGDPRRRRTAPAPYRQSGAPAGAPGPAPAHHPRIRVRCSPIHPPGSARHWLDWRRRYQARSASYHLRTQLTREAEIPWSSNK